MKTLIQIISLLFALLITPMIGSAISIYENPQPCIDELMMTPINELDESQVDSYKQFSIVVTKDVDEETVTKVTYINFLVAKTMQNKEFYLKRVVTINESTQMRLTVYKVKFGNYLFKVILNNWHIYRILSDDI